MCDTETKEIIEKHHESNNLIHGITRICSHLILTKKRRCRMIAMKGAETCPAHAISNSNDTQRLRISCPLDPKHTVFASMIKKHLKKCNARKTESLHPFFSFGINNGDPPTGVKGLGLNDLDEKQLLRLIDKIKLISKLHVPETHNEIGLSNVLLEEINNPSTGKETKRHLRQTASILSLLEKENCLSPNTCFVEFGSGKGGLTYWIAKAVPNPETQSFVLVDRLSPRRKKDNKLQETDVKVERIRIDIKDLKLDEVSFVRKSKYIVGVNKHLCGAATDLALRCLLETNGLAKKLAGIVFATCCHHQCSYESFVAKDILQNWGFTEEEFRSLTCITSWNVCGTPTGKFSAEHANNGVKYFKLNLSLPERQLIGLNAKKILDYARCLYIQSFGLESRYATFATTLDTPENRCIVALTKKHEIHKPVS